MSVPSCIVSAEHYEMSDGLENRKNCCWEIGFLSHIVLLQLIFPPPSDQNDSTLLGFKGMVLLVYITSASRFDLASSG